MAERQRSKRRSNTAEPLGRLASDEEDQPSLGGKKQRGALERVRVWWPPTRDKNRTGYSGAFWPAAVVARGKSHFTVRYDNEDEERVNCENIFPHDVPIGFGEEVEELLVGEFVEVSNGSTTDPCAWLGCINQLLNGGYEVRYPFHDAPNETIKRPLIRRARIWDGEDWKYIQPGLTWRDGEVASPKELNLLDEKQYLAAYNALSEEHAANGEQPGQPAKPNKRKGQADGGTGSGGDDEEIGDQGMEESDPQVMASGQRSVQQWQGQGQGQAHPEDVAKEHDDQQQQLQLLQKVISSVPSSHQLIQQPLQQLQQQALQHQPPPAVADAGLQQDDADPTEQLVQRLLVSASSSLAAAPSLAPGPLPMSPASPAASLPPAAHLVSTQLPRPAPLSSAAPMGAPAAPAQAPVSALTASPAGDSVATAAIAPAVLAGQAPPAGGIAPAAAAAAASAAATPVAAPYAASAAATAPTAAAPTAAAAVSSPAPASLRGVPLPPELSDALGVPKGTFAMGTVHCDGTGGGGAGELLVLAVPKQGTPGHKAAAGASPFGAAQKGAAAPSPAPSSASAPRTSSIIGIGKVKPPVGPAGVADPGALAAALSAALAGVGGPLGSSGSGNLDGSGHKKRKKDPLAPKKAVSAYQVFMARHRENVVAQNPGLGAQDTMKMLGHMWKAAGQEEKDECDTVAQQDRERYNQQLTQFKANKAAAEATLASLGIKPGAAAAGGGGGDAEGGAGAADSELPSKKKKKHAPRDPNAPPKPTNAYLFFQAAYRKTLLANMPADMASKLCGEAWRTATPEDKVPYEQMASREKERFLAAMAEYNARKAQQASQLAAALQAVLGGGAAGGQQQQQQQVQQQQRQQQQQQQPQPQQQHEDEVMEEEDTEDMQAHEDQEATAGQQQIQKQQVQQQQFTAPEGQLAGPHPLGLPPQMPQMPQAPLLAQPQAAQLQLPVLPDQQLQQLQKQQSLDQQLQQPLDQFDTGSLTGFPAVSLPDNDLLGAMFLQSPSPALSLPPGMLSASLPLPVSQQLPPLTALAMAVGSVPIPGGMPLPGSMPVPNPSLLAPPPWGFASPASAASPFLVTSEVQDILDTGLDIKQARRALGEVYAAEAYHLLLDAWRSDSARVRDAVRSWRAHVEGEDDPDYRGFMIGIYGLERMRGLELKHPPTKPAPAPKPAPHKAKPGRPFKRKRGRPPKPKPAAARRSPAPDQPLLRTVAVAVAKRRPTQALGAHAALGLAYRGYQQQQREAAAKLQIAQDRFNFPFTRWDDEDARLVQRPVTKRQRAMFARREEGPRRRRRRGGRGSCTSEEDESSEEEDEEEQQQGSGSGAAEGEEVGPAHGGQEHGGMEGEEAGKGQEAGAVGEAGAGEDAEALSGDERGEQQGDGGNVDFGVEEGGGAVPAAGEEQDGHQGGEGVGGPDAEMGGTCMGQEQHDGQAGEEAGGKRVRLLCQSIPVAAAFDEPTTPEAAQEQLELANQAPDCGASELPAADMPQGPGAGTLHEVSYQGQDQQQLQQEAEVDGAQQKEQQPEPGQQQEMEIDGAQRQEQQQLLQTERGPGFGSTGAPHDLADESAAGAAATAAPAAEGLADIVSAPVALEGVAAAEFPVPEGCGGAAIAPMILDDAAALAPALGHSGASGALNHALTAAAARVTQGASAAAAAGAVPECLEGMSAAVSTAATAVVAAAAAAAAALTEDVPAIAVTLPPPPPLNLG